MLMNNIISKRKPIIMPDFEYVLVVSQMYDSERGARSSVTPEKNLKSIFGHRTI